MKNLSLEERKESMTFHPSNRPLDPDYFWFTNDVVIEIFKRNNAVKKNGKDKYIWKVFSEITV